MNKNMVSTHLSKQNQKKVKYQSLDPGYHPIAESSLNKMYSEAEMIEIYLPAHYYVEGARKFTDTSAATSADMVLSETILKIIECFNYISEEIGTEMNSAETYPKQMCIFQTLTKTKTVENTTYPVFGGIRYRIMLQESSGEGIADIITALLARNLQDSLKERGKREAKKKPHDESNVVKFLHALDLKAWVELCQVYLGEPISLDSVQLTPLRHPDNPANPINVFSLANSCVFASNQGCDAELCDVYQFKTRDGTWDFPNKELVWRMKPYYLTPGSASSVYWPCVEPSCATNETLRSCYVRDRLPPLPDPPVYDFNGDVAAHEKAVEAYEKELEDFRERHKKSIENLKHVYDHTIARAEVIDDVADDIETLKKKFSTLIEEGEKIYGDRMTNEEKRKVKEEVGERILKDFCVVFSANSEAPDAIRSIARWMNAYTSQYETFCMPLPKITNNLTRFGDEMVMMGIVMESLFNVHTNHIEIFSLFLKQLYVYSNSPFNINTLFGGPKATGKSHVMKQVMDWLITGTFINTAYSSLKANVVPGNKNDFLIRFYEDVSPQFVGIGTGSKGSETANSEWEALLKAWTTTGEINAQVLDTSGGRLNAQSCEIKAKVHAALNFATNAATGVIPSSVRSRFDVRPVQNKERLTTGGLFSKSSKSNNPEQINAMELFRLRFQRNQAFSAIIFQLIYIGKLPKIDMTVAKIIIGHALETAQHRHMKGTDDKRNKERVEMLTEVLVVWDSISMVWDSPDTPIGTHDITHFNLVARYLRATVEHATFALGLMSNQFEDNIVHSVIDDLMATKFKINGPTERISGDLDLTSVATIEAQKKFKKVTNKKTKTVQQTIVEEEVTEEEEHANKKQKKDVFVPRPKRMPAKTKNYFTAEITENSANREALMKADNNKARVRILAEEQFKNMREKPLKDDLIEAYEILLNMTVTDEEHIPTVAEPIKHIPALDFNDGLVMLSVKIVEGNKLHGLLDCTLSAINHKYATPAEYVYGITRPLTPFLFTTVKVGPGTPGSHDRLTILDPNYFDKHLIKLTEKYLQGIAVAKSKKTVSSKTLLLGSSTDTIVRPTRKRKRTGKDELIGEAQEAPSVGMFSLMAAYSKRPRKIIDLDLNTYAERVFKMTADVSKDALSLLPLGHPLERRDELIDHYKTMGLPLIRYPDDLPDSQPHRLHNEQIRDMKKNPQKYSLLAELEHAEKLHAMNENHFTLSDALSQAQTDIETDGWYEAVHISGAVDETVLINIDTNEQAKPSSSSHLPIVIPEVSSTSSSTTNNSNSSSSSSSSNSSNATNMNIEEDYDYINNIIYDPVSTTILVQ